MLMRFDARNMSRHSSRRVPIIRYSESRSCNSHRSRHRGHRNARMPHSTLYCHIYDTMYMNHFNRSYETRPTLDCMHAQRRHSRRRRCWHRTQDHFNTHRYKQLRRAQTLCNINAIARFISNATADAPRPYNRAPKRCATTLSMSCVSLDCASTQKHGHMQAKLHTQHSTFSTDYTRLVDA